MTLQHVTAGQLKPGQKVKYLNKKAWWKVDRIKDNGEVVLRRGETTHHLTKGYPLLQELFANL
jgi:hypothetical protein